jgi:hypothetical protein
MLKGKVEPACYWCAELVCSGHFSDIWEYLLLYMAKYVHLGNPRLPIYMEMRYGVFRNIMNGGTYVREMDLRNDEKIRKLFAEIICTLTLSVKKPSIEPLKINRAEEFDMTFISDRLKAPSMEYAAPLFRPKDPKELFIAMNEFAYCLSAGSANMMDACYWIEWVIEFDGLCRSRKQVCKCEARANTPVERKFCGDIIWMVWDAFFFYCDLLKNPLLEKCLQSLHRLFCIKYTTATCRRRHYILYYAVGLLTEPVQLNTEILPNREVLQVVTNKINEIYKQIKRNEELPSTEYLFHGFEKQRSLEKSMAQMELVSKIDGFS